MKSLENTTIADLMVKEFDNRNMIATKKFAKFIPEILFKGVAAYLNSLEFKSVVAHISAPVYSEESRNEFMSVYFSHINDNEYILKFYNIGASVGQEDGFKDVDETIYLYDDEDAIKFLEEVAYLHGAVFMPTKNHTDADNMLSTLACFIYAVESYLIATYDKNGDNTVEIPGIVRAKLQIKKLKYDEEVDENNKEVDEYNEVYMTTFEPLFDLKEIDDLATKVKEELNKEDK